MVLTKQIYNNQDKQTKPKDIHKKPQKTKPNKTKLTLVKSPLTTSSQETDRAYSNKKPQLPEPARGKKQNTNKKQHKSLRRLNKET